eukprot:CAMPEP_0197942348 /NCGR_PEP_ID=MMETSP1439-20131203/124218_1 /TAXON_ID=66791 /ORGANISM="Gonyaulax spinifera, Strain CCMP409" /LENGTH=36 /DNA_ID= /DNA_START= /DNA_END= /DNA_ORIENTATION=
MTTALKPRTPAVASWERWERNTPLGALASASSLGAS